MSKDARVLIVGAGPAGLALALTLLRNGVSVRIIEKRPTFQVGARGWGLQPRTLELYKFLDIMPDIMEASGLPPQMKNWPAPEDGSPGKAVSFLEMLEGAPSRPYPNLRILGQDFQEGILRDNILKDYNCQVELAMELCSFEQYSDHVVVQLVKASEGKGVTETASFDWLVGADGARSVVRKQLGLSFLGESPPAVAQVIGDIYIKKGSLDPQTFYVWGNMTVKACVIRLYEIPGDDRCNFFISGREVDLEKAASSRDELIKTIHDITGRHDLEFGELICMNIWRPNIRMANKFSEGRVFVVGDAAHVHSPTGGQGMNSGVQDSINLGWKLALVQKGLTSRDILNSYSQERLPIIASMLNKTTELFRSTFKATDDGRESWRRPHELRQLGVNYRGSPIIVDEKHIPKADERSDPYRSGDDGSVRAGDRAPEAPGLVHLDGDRETVVSLFEIFKANCHTVLVFSHPKQDGKNAEVAQALSSYPKGTVKSVFIFPKSVASSAFSAELGDSTLVDREGYAYQHYAITGGFTVVVVRPDGYIGALVGGSEGVKEYFKRIFIH